MGLLDNIGGWELLVIVLLGLFIFGPDRLPKAISDGVGMLRQLRKMARDATGDLSKELGADIDLEDLHPKTFIRKHLLSEEDELAIRKPLESVYGSLRDELREASDVVHEVTDAVNGKSSASLTTAGTVSAGTAPVSTAPVSTALVEEDPGPGTSPSVGPSAYSSAPSVVDFDAT